MKEVAYNKHHDQKGFLFIFDIPETDDSKGVNDVAITIHIPPYSEYGKMPDTQYMEVVAKLLAEADWYSIAKDEYFGKDYEGNEMSIPDEDWEYSIRYGAKRTTFIEKLSKIKPHYWYAVREILSVGEFSKHEGELFLFVETDTGLKMRLCPVGNQTLRFSVFEDESYFNSLMMDYETTIAGKFSITTGNSIDKTEKLIDLDGKYNIYNLDDNLFAFVKKG